MSPNHQLWTLFVEDQICTLNNSTSELYNTSLYCRCFTTSWKEESFFQNHDWMSCSEFLLTANGPRGGGGKFIIQEHLIIISPVLFQACGQCNRKISLALGVVEGSCRLCFSPHAARSGWRSGSSPYDITSLVRQGMVLIKYYFALFRSPTSNGLSIYFDFALNSQCSVNLSNYGSTTRQQSWKIQELKIH